jgi:streptogramin lyase
MTTKGELTEYPVPTAASCPMGITTIATPGVSPPTPTTMGFLVAFTESQGNKIGLLAPDTGVIVETTLPRASSGPMGISAGPDGVVWFTERLSALGSNDRIGSMDVSSLVVTEYNLSTGGDVAGGILAEADGSVWIAETSPTQGRIGLWRTSMVGECTIPSWEAQPYHLVAGPDGNIWFTEYGGGIARLTRPTGARPSCAVFSFTEYATPTSSSSPVEIIVGPKCKTTDVMAGLWFTESARGKLACSNVDGDITEYTLGGSVSPFGLALGADGNLWFTEPTAARIGRWRIP